MGGRLFGLLIVWISIQATLSASQPGDLNYYGGVAELPFARTGTAEERLAANLKNYLSMIETDTASFADILTFPEGTLNSLDTATIVPNPWNDSIAPCDVSPQNTTYNDFLRQISCAVKKAAIYVLINLSEKEACVSTFQDPRNCTISGFSIYNTNIVFDRTGRVISRYRREESKEESFDERNAWFDTDFGVRFGHLIGSDLLSFKPAQYLADEFGVRDFLLPSMWKSELPFHTSLQFASSWAYGNGAAVLIASASSPALGYTGTGAFTGNLASTFVSANEAISVLSVIMITKSKQDKELVDMNTSPFKQLVLPVNQTIYTTQPQPAQNEKALAVRDGFSQTNITLGRDNLELYETELLNLNVNSRYQQTLCFNNTEFCCHFDLDWSNWVGLPNGTQYYKYRLGIFDGWHKDGNIPTHKVRNCALFSCTSDQLGDCGKLFPGPDMTDKRPLKSFIRVSINGMFPESDEYLLMPNSLKDDLYPLFRSDYEWTNVLVNTDTGPKRNVTLTLKRTTDNLLTFALYGNYYNGTDKSSAALSGLSAVVLLMAGIIYALF